MILFKKLFQNISLITLALISTNTDAQCYKAYSYCGSTACMEIDYKSGDTLSHGGRDYILNNVSWSHYAPNPSIPIAWTQLPTTCSTSKPGLYDTKLRANYCTTSMPIGRASSDGNDAFLSARGFVFGTTPNPNLNDDDVLLDAGNSLGDEYEGLMEDLTPETTYFVRSYATNSQGTTYGTEVEFKTRKTSECVADCDLACDFTTPGLLNPSVIELNTTYSIIGIEDTMCITEDRSYSGSTVRGMLKVCNGATLTISGTMSVETVEQGNGQRGQIVYEGCNERINGTGSYKGSKYYGTLGNPSDHDPKQMISYCKSTCDESNRSQFVNVENVIHLWSATCRPTTTLLNPLPVELISFKASLENNGALLEWVTGSEINNSHFDVEISNDGVNWTTIGIVQGSGNSNQPINYSFSSNQTDEGIHYFRLKQIDFDGSFAYSNVKFVSFTEGSKPKGFIAFQNSNNQVEIQAKFNGMGEALLYDSRGKLIEFKTFISTNNSGTNIKFNTVDLAEGVYFVKIKSGNALLGDKVQIIK